MQKVKRIVNICDNCRKGERVMAQNLVSYYLLINFRTFSPDKNETNIARAREGGEGGGG